MNPERKRKYLKNRRDARYFYRNTDMKLSQIARLLKTSETHCSTLICGGHKEPKFIQTLIRQGVIDR